MNKENVKKEVFEWTKYLMVSVVLSLIVVNFVAQSTKVYSVSMQPTIYEGNRILIEKISQKMNLLKRGEIIAFKAPTQDENFIKRIIGLPGDKVVIKDGKVFVNDKELHEPYLKDGTTNGSINLVVPSGKLFVMGDNRLNSYDSRAFGCIDLNSVVGRALFQYYPLDKISSLNQKDPIK
ncbi:MAG: signal peptidase I [Bacillota bacterium]|nr:signal peptidase I [Bacillota bacterium]